MVFWLAIGLLFWGQAKAEDERSFSWPGENVAKMGKKAVFEHRFPDYLVDLTGDQKKERIYFVNQDGKDYMHISNDGGKDVGRYDFRAVGLDATPFKIWFRSLSSTAKVLLVYYYEGYTDYLKFLGSVRLYFFTFENNDLRTLSKHRGPSVFYEYAKEGKSYRQRRYRVEVIDFNGDGKRDILVKYSNIMDIFLYQGKGKWLHQTRPVM